MDTNAKVLQQEGHESTSDGNGGRRGFICKLSEAFVVEHQRGVGEQLE